MTDTMSNAIVLSLIAATIPLVASIFSAFHPSSRVKVLDDYFLYQQRLDLDGFLKTSIGYSLQVAAIYLFFTWSFSYGLWALTVPVFWGAGYWLLGKALDSGKLDNFLRASQTPGELRSHIATIHGFVRERLSDGNSKIATLAVWLLALSTIIGVGGAMITEIDYSARFLLSSFVTDPTAAAAPTTPTPRSTNIVIHLVAIAFILFYVLWGGYKAVVLTERYQVPFAYGSFIAFLLVLALLLRSKDSLSAMPVYATAATVAISGVVWYTRMRLARFTADLTIRSTAIFTFLPLTILAGAAWLFLVVNGSNAGLGSIEVVPPKLNQLFGFGFIGMLSLLLANAIWQFIDISSLQRLQSVEITIEQHRAHVAHGIRATGVEAACGWVLIVIAGFLLKAAGADAPYAIPALLLNSGTYAYLLPVFIFAVVVFMVSTASTFVSAMSYVAYYDLVPNLHVLPKNASTEVRLVRARLTTIVVTGALYLGYVILKLNIGAAAESGAEEKISAVLYAVYAFQLAITPSVLVALFSVSSMKAWHVCISVITGLCVAWYIATKQEPFAFVGQDSWYVFPPLAVVFSSCLVYAVASALTRISPEQHKDPPHAGPT